MRLCFYAIAFAEQAREAGMRNGYVQAIRIIVADIFPVHIARPHGDAAKRFEFLKAVRRDLGLIRGHHVRDRGAIAFKTDKYEPAPDFHIDGHKARLALVERWVRCAVGHAGQAAIKVIGPCVIGADELFRTSVRAVNQTASAVAADIGKGAQHVVIAAYDDHALADIIKAVPVARVRNVADMAYDLP